MHTPPTLSTLEEVATLMRDKHAALAADAQTTGAQKTAAFAHYIKFMLKGRSIQPQHVPNLQRSLNSGGHSELVRDGPRLAKYLPIDAVLRRALEALELDRPVVRDAWKELRARADEQLAAFGDDDAPPAKRAKPE
jgi:hypothetical protein